MQYLRQLVGIYFIFLPILPLNISWLSAQDASNASSSRLSQSLLQVRDRHAFSSPLYPIMDSVPDLAKKRKKVLAITLPSLYLATMGGLYVVWYKDSELTSFHFFNDNSEWKQIDKVGHFYSAYQFSRLSAEAFRWAKLPEKKALLWGTLSGIILMTPIEILDGFSSEYGASWGDFVANTTGSFFLFGQYLLWEEIRIHPKFSFFPSGLASQRPELLGDGLAEEFIKDYNGQTYWLSVDVDKFLPESSAYPKWLSIAVGYGAQDMIYARDVENRELAGRDAYRQYYLGLDFDLTAFKPRRKFWRVTLDLLNMIRLPGPTLEYNRQQGVRFHPFFF
ncbi:MAG: DUF2279 domain-containing protein [Bacteroidota bacterium]